MERAEMKNILVKTLQRNSLDESLKAYFPSNMAWTVVVCTVIIA